MTTLRTSRESSRPGKRLSGLRACTFAARWLAAVALVAGSAVGAGPVTNHWAFEPIRPVGVPSVDRHAARVQTPVDNFIATRLEQEGMTLALAADRRSLIRRASFDLTGLPPEPKDVEEFVNDPAPDAFARWVERLLGSPHYGERWGRWWLDLARYADTNGQDENKVMANAWRYRDWVIRSFNADQPFDAFVTDQLAGDLLPTEGISERVVFDRWTATGFLVLGPKMLAEQDKPKLVMDLVDEQIDTVGRAFLGLTISCARCHDHKFDPIPTRDYYALAGIFKSTRAMENLDFVSKFNERRIATREELAEIDAHERLLKAANERVASAQRDANAALVARWRSELPRVLAAVTSGGATHGLDTAQVEGARALFAQSAATNGVAALLREMAAASSADFAKRLEDLEQLRPGLRTGPGKVGSALLCDGHNSVELPHTLELEPARFTLETWVRVDELPKEGDPRRWLVSKNANEWADGHFALVLDARVPAAYLNVSGGRGGEVLLRASGRPLKPREWHHLAMTFDESTLRLFVNGDPAGELAVGRPRVRGNGPLVAGRRPDGFVHFVGALDEIRLLDQALSADAIHARFENPGAGLAGPGLLARWDFDTLTAAEQAEAARGQLREALFGAAGLLAPPKDPRPLYPAAVRDALIALESERDRVKAQAPPPPAFVLAAAEDKPVELPVHVRGSHLNLAKDPVPRGFIRAALRGSPPPVPLDRSGRLELARWLTSPENPLTARVVVNRLWQAHFGEGLVRTPDNFGVRGEPPAHPELLDWLAGEFVRSGWSVKHVHRLILNSATWQAKSSVAGDDRRSANDPDNRLLSHFPRQRLEAEMVRDALLAVSGRLDRTTGGTLVNWKNNEYTPADDVSAKSVRRTVYLPIVRDRVYDVLTIFDCANPSVGTARRTPTVVSHQALFFLNSPLVKESAQTLAATVTANGADDDAARVRQIYARILQRSPTVAETARALRFVGEAGSLLKSERTGAWATLCQTLLASNEFLYRD